MISLDKQRGFLLNPFRFSSTPPPSSPTIMSSSVTTNTSETTSHVFNMPSGIQSNDLLLIIVSVSSDATISSVTSGWTLAGQTLAGFAVRGLIYTKIATGGESFSFTTNFAEQSASVCYRIQNATTVQLSSFVTNAVLSTTTYDPSSLTITGGPRDALWFAALSTLGDTSVTTWPTDYNNQLSASGINTTNGASVFVGSRFLNTSTQDPSSFTLGTGRPGVCVTIGAY